MKLIFKTSDRTCFVKVPNYTNHSHVPDLISKVEDALDTSIDPESVILHSDDWLTDDEHKQLDVDGRIVRPMTEVKLH